MSERTAAAADTAQALSLSDRQAWDALLAGLAEIFAAEGRPGGDLAAEAARASIRQPYHRLDERTDPDLMAAFDAALRAPDAAPFAETIAAAASMIPWHYSGLSDGRIPGSLAKHMQTSYLIGAHDAAVFHPSLYIGLFFQNARVDYPVRSHAAEETFHIVSGAAEWRIGDAPFQAAPPGAYIHHPPYVQHASRTGSEPVLTVWRWTGDVDFKTYELER